jgi:nicotinate-nucleotide adenylyltransferase
VSLEKDTDPSLRIGLFGGTFNPVHLGHLRSAEEIREKFNLSKIIFVPSRIPPHKKTRITPSELRFEMVKLSTLGNPFFEVSEIELQRPGNSYFFETLDYFNNLFENRTELFFIMGLDAFREIRTWKKYPHFFSACNFIIMSRPGADHSTLENVIPLDANHLFRLEKEKQRYVHTSGHTLSFCKISLLEISSTAIRKNISEGKTIKYLVPDSVEQYIRDHELLRDI